MRKYVFSAIIIAAGLMLTGCGGKSASQYNREGMEFYENMDYEQAGEYLEKALESDEDNTEYIQNYAMILIQLGRQDEAVEKFNSTITDKKSGSAQKINKYAYRGIGMAYLQSKEYEKSIENFDKALDIDEAEEWNNDISYYKANALKVSGDTEGAEKIYTELIKSNPENAAIYKARADLYRETGKLNEAVNDYNSAELYDQSDFEIYIGLASCYIELGKQEQADEALFLASLLDIKTDKDKYYLGVIHYYQKKFDSARDEMEYAMANGVEEAGFYLAEIYLMEGDYERASQLFNEYADSTVVESPTVCNDISVCLIRSGQYDEALEWINKGLMFKVSGVEKQLKRNRIACYEGNGMLPEAFYLLEKYVIEYPEDEGAAQEYNFLSQRTTAVPVDMVEEDSPSDSVTEPEE